MDLRVKRSEGLELFKALRGLTNYTTQAAFLIATNYNVVDQLAKEHDKFDENLRKQYATKRELTEEEIESGQFAEGQTETFEFEDDNKTLKIEGNNLIRYQEDYDRYLDEEIELKGFKPFNKGEFKTRINKPGHRTEVVSAEIPAAYLAPLSKHKVILDSE